MKTMPPPRRSCLSVPGSSAKMLSKVATLGADEFVLDLEDGVAPKEKEAARSRVAEIISRSELSRARVSVRINSLRTEWGHDDLVALSGVVSRSICLVVPKVESADELASIDGLLTAAGRDVHGYRPARIQALIETASGLSRIDEIAVSSERLDALVLGYADLAASLGRSASGARDIDGWRWAQEVVLIAARASGLQAVDGPYFGLKVDEGFLAAATRAKDMGFDGKWTIHPSQIPVLNELFTPSAEEVGRAHAIIAKLDQADQSGVGAVAMDGEMIDEAMRTAAWRTLARAPK